MHVPKYLQGENIFFTMNKDQPNLRRFLESFQHTFGAKISEYALFAPLIRKGTEGLIPGRPSGIHVHGGI